MKLKQIVEALGATNLTPELADKEDVEVAGGYASDLLSDVLANAPAGGIVVTIQAHLNTVAVALHARLAAVILAMGREPEPSVLTRASEEGVPVYLCKQSTFDAVGKLYELGLRGGGR